MNGKYLKFSIFLAIFFVALGLRLFTLNVESFWLDETLTLNAVNVPTISEAFNRVINEVHMPLYKMLAFFWVRMFGISEFATRILSLLFGMFSVVVTYFLAKRMFNCNVGLFSMALMAVSPAMIYYSQEFRSYSLFVFLVLVSTYFLIIFFNEMKIKYLVLYVISSIFLIYTHYFAFLTIISQNLFFVIFNLRNFGILKKWFLGQLVLLCSFLPWIPIFLSENYSSVDFTVHLSWDVFVTCLFDILGNNFMLVIFTIALFVFFILNFKIFSSDSEKKPMIIFIILIIFVSFLLTHIYSELVRPMFCSRYLVFLTPFFLILLAYMLFSIERINSCLSFILLGLVLLSLAISGVQTSFGKDHDDWRSVSGYLADVTDSEDLILLVPRFNIVAIQRYSSRIHWSNLRYYVKPGPDCLPEYYRCFNSSQYSDFVDKSIYVLVTNSEYSYILDLKSYLDANMELNYTKKFDVEDKYWFASGGITLYKYEPKQLE